MEGARWGGAIELDLSGVLGTVAPILRHDFGGALIGPVHDLTRSPDLYISSPPPTRLANVIPTPICIAQYTDVQVRKRNSDEEIR